MHRNRARAVRLVLGVVAIALVAAACGSDNNESSGSGKFTPVNSGKLTVCSDTPYAPFEFQDDQKQWTGFDMDLMREIGKRIDNLQLDVKTTPFDAILLAPRAGKCDIVASAVTITDERKKNALFSDPYYDSGQSLLVRTEDKSTYPDLASLKGKTIGVQQGTTGEEYANENKPDGATIKTFPDAPALFLALSSNDVQAVLQDLPVNQYRAKQEPGKFVVVGKFDTGEQYGFATKPSNTDLIKQVNEQLAALKSDGTYNTLYEKYFGAPSS